uniref:Uncharacterized protein n=1 Tax=Amphiprion ocellaris TaxID=80972 RepID=A0A3Q1ALG2_AMPOC
MINQAYSFLINLWQSAMDGKKNIKLHHILSNLAGFTCVSIRCPKKYGETIKERQCMLAPRYESDLVYEQREGDPQKPLDDRYIRNAAVIPDLSQPHRARVVSTEEKTFSGDLMIHGFTVPDYQQTYHSVVDPLLSSPSGEHTAYSLELGHTIKEHLFEELAYPKLQVSEHPNGKEPEVHESSRPLK